MRTIHLAPLIALCLVACGPGGDPVKPGGGKLPAAKTARALPTGPSHSTVGVVISLEGAKMVLDHEAVEGGLAAGRHTFQVDATVLAEAPMEPGDRVAFSYQDWTPEPLLVELKTR